MIRAQRTVTIVCATLPLLVAVAGATQKDFADKTGLGCTLTPAKSRVLPFESIEFVFAVHNQTDTVKEHVKGSFRPWIFYPVERGWFRDPQHIEADGIKWDGYQADMEPFIAPPLNILSFAPREMKIWVKLLEYEKGEHKLGRPGRYLFKGAIDEFICNKVNIVVQKPQGVDKTAYEYLLQHPLHYFFHEWTLVKYPYNQATVEALERFIVRFKRSQYAEMAKLGLALMWREGVEGKKDLERAQRLLQEVAKSADEARAARAYYYLGQLEEEQGQLIEAQQYYTGALSLKVDAYIRWRAEEAREAIEQQLSAPKR